MTQFLAPIINDQQEDANGAPLSGGTIEVYLAGSSTPATTTSDKAGLVPNTWPITLNTLGVNSQGSVWITGGASYKFVIKSSVGVVQRTIDNVSGINDNTVAANDQWVVYQGAPTYISATSFSVAGDQTQIFQVNRRIRTTNTGGTIYSTITASAYSAPNTTITVRNDSGVLDAGLTQVSYGLISSLNSSVTGLLLGIRVFTATGTYTPTTGTTKVLVMGQGAGGGGGGAPATSAGNVGVSGGGGAGGVGEIFLTTGFSGATVTIAPGGAGGVGASAGAPAGTSSFGAVLNLTGGSGGGTGPNASLSFAFGGQGGGSSGGLFVGGGANGDTAISTFVQGYAVSGRGGASNYGSGGRSVFSGGGAAVGEAATGCGAGGSGAVNYGASTAQNGGAGTGGIIFVYEYA